MNLLLKVEMKKVLEGMNAGIGTGRAGQLNGQPVQGLKGFFYFRLNGNGIFLYLETAVARAFIRYLDKITGHALLSYQRFKTFGIVLILDLAA